jgi:predicted MPP superfamily phosphohydrolase
MTMILSRGLGNSLAPVRINDYPELVVVKVH